MIRYKLFNVNGARAGGPGDPPNCVISEMLNAVEPPPPERLGNARHNDFSRHNDFYDLDVNSLPSELSDLLIYHRKPNVTGKIAVRIGVV